MWSLDFVSKSILNDPERIRSLVEWGGRFKSPSNYSSNREERQKSPYSSFQFNAQWLKDDGFINLVNSERVKFDPSSRETTSLQPATNLKKVKIVVTKWAYDKRSRDEQALVSVQKESPEIYSRDYVTSFDNNDRLEVRNLENVKRKLL
jgi:hypothetical protein